MERKETVLRDLIELRTFQRILELGSLSAASREMNVSLTVVSKRLAALERRVGMRLVNRNTRRLSPTGDGADLLSHVNRILSEVDAAEESLSNGDQEPKGLLRVAAPISFGRVHLAPVLGRLAQQFPAIQIDLRLDDHLLDLIESRLDVAVRIGVAVDSAFVMRKLFDSRRILVASRGYLDRSGRPDLPTELREHVLLGYGDQDARLHLIGPAGEHADLSPLWRLRANSGDAVHDWAVAGLGIMFKSEIDVRGDIKMGILERVLSDWSGEPAPVYALFPNRLLPARVRLFLTELMTHLRPLLD